jgi:hypothetical protein
LKLAILSITSAVLAGVSDATARIIFILGAVALGILSVVDPGLG